MTTSERARAAEVTFAHLYDEETLGHVAWCPACTRDACGYSYPDGSFCTAAAPHAHAGDDEGGGLRAVEPEKEHTDA
jgi:hypothetical protein